VTGPERETLSQALELQRLVLSSLDAFRLEFMGTLTDFRKEVREAVDGLDNRLVEVERAELSYLSEAAGVAKYVAHAESVKERRSISTRAWLTVAATLGGLVAGVVIKVAEVFVG